MMNISSEPRLSLLNCYLQMNINDDSVFFSKKKRQGDIDLNLSFTNGPRKINKYKPSLRMNNLWLGFERGIDIKILTNLIEK
jgi:hypothetical protein